MANGQLKIRNCKLGDWQLQTRCCKLQLCVSRLHYFLLLFLIFHADNIMIWQHSKSRHKSILIHKIIFSFKSIHFIFYQHLGMKISQKKNCSWSSHEYHDYQLLTKIVLECPKPIINDNNDSHGYISMEQIFLPDTLFIDIGEQ